MYTVVLMTALTAGNATSDHFLRGGCRGGNACYGNSCYGCNGGGCYGNNCNGCSGGGCYGSNCYGCWGGGCYGSNCYGCWGGGCSGGGWTHGATYGCSGSWAYGQSTFVGGGCNGCFGCYGGHSGYGMPTAEQGYIINPLPKDPVKKTTPLPKGPKDDDDDSVQQVRAKVSVDVPIDGKLYVDGQLMRSGSGLRTFQTPVLQPGQTYFYDIRVEITRNGVTLSDTQRVVLNPGQTATASFANLERQANASATAQVR